MVNNNVQNVRFLRNSSLFGTREAALNGLNEQSLNDYQDGSIILARYGSGSNVKTLVGVVYYVDGSNKSLTIFDVDGASADVDALRTEINNKLGTTFISSGNTVEANLTALSGNAQSTSAETSVAGAKAYAKDYTDGQIGRLDYDDTAVTGQYVSQVSQADGVIAVTRVALPDASTVSGESKVVIDVTQNKGAVTATAANLTGVKLDGLTSGTDAKIAATDTLGEALANIQAQIDAMDKTADAVDGQVVTTVTETDGKVTETKANVKDLQLGGYVKTNDTGDIASADTVNVALSKLENKAAAITIANADGSINVTTAATGTDINVNIKSGEVVIAKDGGDGIYTDLDLVKITTGLPETIKERYQFLATDDSQIGTNIDIPKDSHIVSINYITTGEHAQNLEYVYIDVSGNTQTTYVDMSELVLETEFGSGVTVTDHVAHGVVDPTSESFFTVGADGFKVAGISAHVQSEIEKLDADVSGNSTHVTVGVEEVNGAITAVTVAEDNIANADDLAELSGKTVTAITSTNGSITASIDDAVGCKTYDIETDASKIKMSGFTTVGGDFSAITEDSSVTDAVQTVVEEVIKNEETVSAALNDLNGDITEEIEARKAVDGQSGQTYTANSGKKYISGATSLNDADVKLNDAIESITSGFISGVQLNGEDLPESDNTVNVQINASNTAASSTDAIVITQDNSTKALTLQLGTIDAGTY